MPGPQWAPVLGWLWAWSVCGVSAQRWGGAGQVWLRVPQRWDEAPGRGLNSECGDDRGSELSLTSALSAQSRAFPLPHRPSR